LFLNPLDVRSLFFFKTYFQFLEWQENILETQVVKIIEINYSLNAKIDVLHSQKF
jgi:hypothetical protein